MSDTKVTWVWIILAKSMKADKALFASQSSKTARLQRHPPSFKFCATSIRRHRQSATMTSTGNTAILGNSVEMPRSTRKESLQHGEVVSGLWVVREALRRLNPDRRGNVNIEELTCLAASLAQTTPVNFDIRRAKHVEYTGATAALLHNMQDLPIPTASYKGQFSSDSLLQYIKAVFYNLSDKDKWDMELTL